MPNPLGFIRALTRPILRKTLPEMRLVGTKSCKALNFCVLILIMLVPLGLLLLFSSLWVLHTSPLSKNSVFLDLCCVRPCAMIYSVYICRPGNDVSLGGGASKTKGPLLYSDFSQVVDLEL